jgi:hypothetical protein
MKVVVKDIKKTAPLRGEQFYPSVEKKTQIFLHHTAGLTAKGAIDWWNQTPEHVGTAFVVDRDGTIYQTFEPDRWGYHLGIKGDDDYVEKHSVGIEIVAAGNLYKAPDEEKFMFFPLFPNKAGWKVIPTEEVTVLGSPWRMKNFYHKYTDAQIESIIFLIHMLRHDFGIEIQDKLGHFYEYNADVVAKKLPGLWSHSTVRADKNDIYPDPKLLEALDSYLAEYPNKKAEETPAPIPPVDEALESPPDETEKKSRKRNK